MTYSALYLRASIALVCVAVLVPLAATAGGMKIAEGRILVKPLPGLDDEKLAKVLEKRGGKSGRKLNRLGVRVVEVPAGRELTIANELNRDPTIAFAEPDFLLSPGAVVNDPNYASQWHLPFTGVPTAWLQTMGAGVTVAVCDTGVNPSHPDLAGQVINGFNTASDNTDTSDINGHGTWVAGVIAAKANNLTGGTVYRPPRRSRSSSASRCWSWRIAPTARSSRVFTRWAGRAAAVSCTSLSRCGPTARRSG